MTPTHPDPTPLPRPLVPRPTPETTAFWEGCSAGELRLQHCLTCDQPWLPPQRRCPRCGGDDLEVRTSTGRGHLASLVIAERDLPGFDAPYVIAIVQLDDGPRLLTNLIDCTPTPEAIDVGLRVAVRFTPVVDSRGHTATLPLFAPDDRPPPAGTPPTTGAASRFSAEDRPDPLDLPGPARRPPASAIRSAPPAVAIVGAAETTQLGTIADLTPLELHLDAAANALADAGVSAADIDGVACAGVSPTEVAFGLGITPGWVDGTMVGGSSFMLHVRHAVAALQTGLATCILITHGESGRSRVGGFPVGRRSPLVEQFELPYGVAGPPTMFTLPALAWMRRYDISEADLASVAVAQRAWASQNPRALRREPLTIDEVLDSPMIAWPFRRHLCCLVTDGGGALVLTTAERAADVAGTPVWVLGSGEATETPMVSQMADLTSSRAFRIAGRRALATAGVGLDDIDHLMAYDAFAHTPCYALEALGFCRPGEGAAFVAAGTTSPGGRLPMNTNGGGLSYTHTGMYGMFAIQESVRQVRGTAPAQVHPDHGNGVRISVAHGVGGMFAASGTLVLGRDPA